jgi:immune inhibitor A
MKSRTKAAERIWSTESRVKSIIKSVAISYLLFLCLISSVAAEWHPGGKSSNDLQFGQLESAQETYRLTGIARRLQEIRQEKEQAVSVDKSYDLDTVSFKIAVIMGNCTDQAHIFDSSDYQELLFGNNPTGSMTEYYDEVSYGQLQLTGQVHGPYTAPETRDYYENGAGYPANFIGFAYALLDSADQHIDFGEYDNDGPDGMPNSGDDDGIVDAVHFIFPDTGGTDRFKGSFSYFWLSSAGIYETNDARSGGGFIEIDEWFRTAGERKPSNLNEINQIGGPVHEFGHALGLPDQYDLDWSTWGVGTWCLMGRGTRGACNCDEGKSRPTHLCAWCKAFLGFVIPIEVQGTETVTIPPVETNPVVYKLWDDSYQGERYFLLENRTKTGFDSDITGEGVLIWHCNGDAAYDNSDESFRIVDLEEADGLDQLDDKTSWMDDGDPYPGSSNNTSFNDMTYPSAVDVFGNATGVSAREILGFTLSYHIYGSKMQVAGPSTPAIRYGAVRFTTPEAGLLTGIQAGLKRNASYDYTVRIFDDINSSTPEGLHASSTTSGTFPSVPSERYYEIALAESVVFSPNQTFLVDVAFGPISYPIPYVHAYPLAQQSYKSNDGITYTHWTDRDILIRARVQYDFTCGDANGDGDVNVGDAVFLIAYVFSGGPPPDPVCEGDANGDGDTNVGDAVFLIAYVFSGGLPPEEGCCP